MEEERHCLLSAAAVACRISASADNHRSFSSHRHRQVYMACFDRCAHRQISAPSVFRRMALPRDPRPLSNMFSCAAPSFGHDQKRFRKNQARLSGPTLSKLTDNLNDRSSQRLRNHWLVSRIISGLRYIVEDTMTETEERDYANGADGISDIEGKVARVATSKLGNERVSVSREDWALRWSR